MERYIHLDSGSEIPGLSFDGPYRAVLVLETRCDPKWQAQVSFALCDSGCRYMMAWGVECSSWDGSVDLANLKQFDFGDIPAPDFVMTTWHGDETLDEVFGFAKRAAMHPDLELTSIAILHIGGHAREAEFMARYDAA